MKLTNVHTSKEQLAQLMAYPKGVSIVMTNIIKFRATTEKGDETGQEAYTRYMKNVQPLLAKAKAKLIWKGKVASVVIGEPQNEPDMILLVEYPDVDHFIGMAKSEAYQKIAIDRSIALEYGGLIACQTL